MKNPYKTILQNEGLPYKTLLGTSSTKTVKGEKLGFLTAILYLTPDDNICAMAKLAGCMAGCLYSSGRGAFNSVQNARQAKTDFWYANQRAFLLSLCADVWSLHRSAAKSNQKLLVRPNGTSDIPWENFKVLDDKTIFQLFPDVQFYDYTKRGNRTELPSNYDLTFSYSGVEGFQPYVENALLNNMRMAVVFRKEKDIPATFMGIPVVSGDNSDVRHLDDKVIVGLYAKGKAKLDTTGFVV